MIPSNSIHLQIQLQELHCDSKIGKDRHFNAAIRKNSYNKRIGITVVLINVLIGSSILSLFEETKIQNGELMKKVLVGLLSFAAASLAAMQTFFNYSRDIENHRKIGNQYLDIARDSDDLLSKLKGHSIESDDCLIQYNKLVKRYKEVNKEGEICPSSPKDYEFAKAKNKSMKKHIKALKKENSHREN